MKRGPQSILPLSLPPRGLSREEAAAYIGVSPSLFDILVKDGRMPGPKHINSRVVWDRLKLDVAFEALDDTDADGTDHEWRVAV
jgi:predicted DNA-binding transcriptional regulator AlpA